MALGLTHASTVIALVKCNAGASGTITDPVTPSKLKAWPTSPAANVAPPRSVPLFVPTRSLALPSPGHQPTRPEGGGVQFVRSAEAVRTMVAEIIVPRRIPGVRTQLCGGTRSFIQHYSQFSYDGLQATVLPTDYAERGLRVNRNTNI